MLLRLRSGAFVSRFCVYAVRLGVGADAVALLYFVLAVDTLS